MTRTALEHTRQWVVDTVIGHQLCPFAKKDWDDERVRLIQHTTSSVVYVVDYCLDECALLDSDDRISTTLIVLPSGFEDFDDFLLLVEEVNSALHRHQYDGVYQLAHFHPDYYFADLSPDDTANNTNRSPFPTLHLIREADITAALEGYPHTERITDRNIKKARALGPGLFLPKSRQ